ncbi:unnamed protein product [Kluyveromyces dobzhanskii CBS 2104]|uniref:WGS project CCBQ000000000 data, contig 00009 n=1 Tax=Kluyveromyces dobzhanskii CBS 2104 TaxID=1427455 RepID=A0A0A8L355_9SACH|nr:unnamed protein product [Kluyveromyces dobzhanskii CBS 2104]
MEKPKRYVPGPNDPLLPPQLTEFQNKTTDEVLEELNKMPFFMNKLDPDENNVELEALKAMAYEGEPDEIATNFKNQGNDLFKAKRFKDARAMYFKGVDIKCNVASINESLYLNLAACELEIKNYRSCINFCKEALKLNAKNVKAFFRIGKAFLELGKLEESLEAVKVGLAVEPENGALKSIESRVHEKLESKRKFEARTLAQKQKEEELQEFLDLAVQIRNIKLINSKQPADLLKDSKLSLENPTDFESQLIFPAMVLYPTTDEFDFIASVSELSTPNDLLQVVLDRPAEWFAQPGHKDFTPSKLQAYMETVAGGLIKIGKKVSIHDVLKMEKPKAPLFDKSLRIYFVPKTEAQSWLDTWDKNAAIMKRL